MTSNNEITPEKQKELNDKLLIAVEKGSVEEVEKLIQEGAEVNSQDNDGKTPLHKAAWRGNSTVVENLIEKGADVNSKDKNDKTPLYEAAWRNHLTVVEKAHRK